MSALVSALRNKSRCGAHLWGSYSVRPVSRTMWSSRTLTVFPPGITPAERLLLRTWHGWFVGGAVLAIGIMAATASTKPGMALAIAVYTAGFLALGYATRRLRPKLRTVTVTTYYGNGRPETYGDPRALAVSLDTLCLLEHAAKTGQVRPVDFEAVWTDVYNLIPTSGTRNRTR
ncbi:MAG: DUF6611 family protein [Curtobacterium sp.]